MVASQEMTEVFATLMSEQQQQTAAADETAVANATVLAKTAAAANRRQGSILTVELTPFSGEEDHN